MLVFNDRFVIRKTLLDKHYIGDLETGRVIILNETAAYIIQMIKDAALEESDLVLRLADAYRAPASQISSDIQDLILEMKTIGVIYDQ